MAVELETLFHGTTMRRIGDALENGSDLIGVRYNDDRFYSATLTNNHEYAGQCAIATRILDDKGKPIILIYEIPMEILILEGQIGKNSPDILGYSTNLIADPQDLPDVYLQYLGITRDEAVSDVAAGKVSFYRVPRKYFRHLDLA